MSRSDHSPVHNPWIKEITEANRLHLRKLIGLPCPERKRHFPKKSIKIEEIAPISEKIPMPITPETKAQSLDILRKHAAQLGISEQFESAVNMPPQEIIKIYNSEILAGQYGIEIPEDQLPQVTTMEEANAWMSNFVDMPMPESIAPKNLEDIKAQAKAGKFKTISPERLKK